MSVPDPAAAPIQGTATVIARSEHPPFEPSRELAVVHAFYSPLAERVRALRTDLLMQAGDDPRGCAITLVSTGSGDGRSRLAAELACAFAQLDHPTLLVDADFRRPSLHRLFGAASALPGLGDALVARETPLPYPVNRMPSLSLMPVGVPPPQPLDLLSGSHFGEVMQAWRREFRFIILDTPPAVEYADALVVAHAGERALLLTRKGRTRMRAADWVVRRLEGAGVEIVGAVLNRF